MNARYPPFNFLKNGLALWEVHFLRQIVCKTVKGIILTDGPLRFFKYQISFTPCLR